MPPKGKGSSDFDDITLKGKVTDIDRDYMEIDGKPVIISKGDKMIAWDKEIGDTVEAIVNPSSLTTRRVV